MKNKNIYLEYIPEYNAWGIADEVIENITQEGFTPIISLKEKDYEKLDCAIPQKKAPTVAFLLGREKGHYTIDFNYAKAVAQSGVNVRFLTYDSNISQMKGVDGLLLPGGSFDSPNEFYTDPLKETDNKPGTRSWAYITSVVKAEEENIPMLGICAGAQIIGGMHGLKMYRSLKEYTDSKIEHKTKNIDAHDVFIYPDTPLYEIMGRNHTITNSRHNEAMLNCDKISDLNIYAISDDGTPEAWGSEEKNILCIQWHPEDFAADGDKSMQNIYNWLANKAHIFQKTKELKQKQDNKSVNHMLLKEGAGRKF